MTNRDDLPFSQRIGLKPVPPQLVLEEVSDQLRRLLEYTLDSEIQRSVNSGYAGSYFDGRWDTVSKDIHVRFLQMSIQKYSPDCVVWKKICSSLCHELKYEELFDFIEFLINHPDVSRQFKVDVASVFVEAKAAYRVFDSKVIAIGNDEQAAAFERAIGEAEDAGAEATRVQLINAAAELKDGNWSGSIRESVHAIESMVVRVAPDARTLGAALAEIEKQGYLHGGLKAAFSALYGYSSDEEGIRHALVFNDESKVDETDALFMLGACASFVSYLQARLNQTPQT